MFGSADWVPVERTLGDGVPSRWANLMRRVLKVAGVCAAFLALAFLTASALSAIGSSAFREWQLVFLRFRYDWGFYLLSALTAGCVGAIFLLFHYERQLVSRGLGYGLLALRLLLVLIVFLVLLEPIWTWTRDETERGRVLVALDVSESMETQDAQAAPQEKLRWARAVGMLGGDETSQLVDGWIQAFEQGEEPTWVSEEEAVDEGRRERLSAARKANVDSVFDETVSLSRLELARRALTQPGQPVLQEIAENVVLQLSAFGESHVPLDPETLKGPFNADGLQLSRARTDLFEGVDAARFRESDGTLAGVVLFSDGRDTQHPQTDRLVTRMQSLGVPVHTVLIGSEFRPRDLSIQHIDHPNTLFVNDKAQVTGIVTTSGFEGTPITVRLESVGEEPPVMLSQVVTPDGPSTEVSFSLDELELGRHRFELKADVLPNETRDDNNGREFSVSVVDDRAQMLIVDGSSRWEFRYLVDALKRDDRLMVDAVLFEQPYLGVLRKPFFMSSLSELEPPVGGASRFSRYDVVLIGDVSPDHLPADVWRDLDRYVQDEGGTLVLTAGQRYFPMAYQGTLAESLLPIENLRRIDASDFPNGDIGPPAQRGFRPSPTKEGDQLPMFQLEPDPARSATVWANLPGQQWGYIGEALGEATVWASVPPPNGQKSLQVDRENALIVHQYRGTGQVVWIGIDGTWRWRFRIGDRYHHRFWGQLTRWAASFKASAGNDLVRVGLRESVIREGQPAVVQIRFDEAFRAQHPDLRAEIVLTQKGGANPITRRVEATSDPDRTLLASAQIDDLPAGEYSIRLEMPNVPLDEPPPDVMLVVNEELTAELRDVTADRALLQQISQKTGGEFLTLDQIGRLPELFENVDRTETVREEVPLFSHWLILVLFCAVAMSEWVLRKINGLP